MTVTTDNGMMETNARVTGDVMPGVVSFPFGWPGRQAGARMAGADQHPGSNVNDITDESLVDPVSGMSAFNETPVTVRKMKGN